MNDTLFVFLLILAASFAFSSLLTRIPLLRIPSTVGYLLFGIILQSNHVHMSHDEVAWLNHLADFGLLFLMYISGMEIDMRQLRPSSEHRIAVRNRSTSGLHWRRTDFRQLSCRDAGIGLTFCIQGKTSRLQPRHRLWLFHTAILHLRRPGFRFSLPCRWPDACLDPDFYLRRLRGKADSFTATRQAIWLAPSALWRVPALCAAEPDCGGRSDWRTNWRAFVITCGLRHPRGGHHESRLPHHLRHIVNESQGFSTVVNRESDFKVISMLAWHHTKCARPLTPIWRNASWHCVLFFVKSRSNQEDFSK